MAFAALWRGTHRSRLGAPDFVGCAVKAVKHAIYAVARWLRRKCRDVQRDSSGEERLEQLASTAPSPAESAEANELAERVRESIDRLPDIERKLVRLHIFNGWTWSAIGIELHMTAEAARKKFERTIGRLAQPLRPWQTQVA